MSQSRKPKGKTLATAKVGEKGQIVIPKEMRDMFTISPGDTLLLLADKEQGIAIVKAENALDFASSVLSALQNPGKEET